MLSIMRRCYLTPIFILMLNWSSLSFSAEPSSTPGSASGTGLEGTISVGPVHGGPSRQGIPDSKPLADTEFQVKKQDGVVASFKTDNEGRFRIALPAGHYSISKKDGAGAVGNYSFEVDLTPNQMKHVHWECDTGIR
jgi:hypothetical protein